MSLTVGGFVHRLSAGETAGDVAADVERSATTHYRVSSRFRGATAEFVTDEHSPDATHAVVAHLTRRREPMRTGTWYELRVVDIDAETKAVGE